MGNKKPFGEILVSMIVACLAAGMFFLPVSSHSVTVVRSDPQAGAILAASPQQVRVWFNEEMDAHTSTLAVVDASGARVDGGDGGVDLTDPDHASMLVSLPELPEGAYRVRWHVVLLDTDATDGEFSFYIGQVGAAAATADAVNAASATPVPSSPPGGSPDLLITGGIAGLALAVVGMLALMLINRKKP